MNIFPWQKKPDFFSADETAQVVAAIRAAEQRTSGEVRVFVESHCRFVDAIDRAAEIFFQLKMDETEQRNGTLVYVAVRDHQAAVFGDEGIHQKVGQAYWETEVAKMLQHFRKNHLSDGLVQCVTDIGEALYQHFPYHRSSDKNELPDEIVFGR